MKLVHFGAGNIGRSFIGQLFARAGWEVVFIDVDKGIIDELNRRGEYIVEVRDVKPERIIVKNVRGVYASDPERVSEEIAQADILSTAVGKNVVPHLMEPIANGLLKRQKVRPQKPLDIIICENMINASLFFRDSLRRELPEDYPLDEMVGLVETSIGKMVPIMSEKDREKDPLLVYAEAYNTLLVDKKGFKGDIPTIPTLDPRENIKAYVDMKLYIHNMGHAVLSYTSFVFRGDYRFVWEAAFDNDIYTVTENAMWESGRALIKEHSEEFDKNNIGSNINDLLTRFKNKALGDNIYRAGRDLYRKLSPDDRLIGSINLCLKRAIFPRFISLGVAAALFFKANDEHGNMDESDRLFHESEVSLGVDHVLDKVCNLKDREVRSIITHYYNEIVVGKRDIRKFFYP